MARRRFTQTNFSAGQLSPKLLGYEDTETYQSGAQLLRNFIVLPQGAAARRPGTYFASEIKDSTAKPRLYPFNYGQGDAYMLEFGNNYIRFYQADTPLLEDVDTYTAAASTDIITLDSASAPADGTQVYLTAQDGTDTGTLAGGTKASIRYFVRDSSGSTFKVALTSGGAAVDLTSNSSGTLTCQKHVEVTTTYTTAELPDLDFTQSADILFIVHPDHAPATLTRTGAAAFTLADITFVDGPYQDINTTATTMDPTGYTGSITIVASGTTGVNGGNGFQDPDDVGRMIRLQNATAGLKWGWGTITAVNSTTSVDVDITEDLGDTSTHQATTEWSLGEWGDYPGYPHRVAFYQDRLTFAATDTEPQGLWFSNTGDYYTFSEWEFQGVVIDNAGTEASPVEVYSERTFDYHSVTLFISSNTVDRIDWLEEGKRLAVGTSGGVYVVYGSADSLTLTPTNFTIERSSQWAVQNGVQPVRVGNSMLYVQNAGRKLREWTYSAQNAEYEALDMTVRADTLTLPAITGIAFQDQPYSVLWMMLSDGGLRGMTYLRDVETYAFHEHVLGGSFSSGDPVVESMGVIPKSTHDQLWLVVKRTINGGTKRYVEFMEQLIEDSDDYRHYVDCGLQYSGSSTASLSGLDHLEGESVDVLGDNAVQPTKTVSSGAITAAHAVTDAAIGLHYDSDLQTMPLSTGEIKDSIALSVKSIDTVMVRLLNTLGLKFGWNASDFLEVIFRSSSDNLGEAVPLFTGVKEMQFEPGGESEQLSGAIYLRAYQPSPCTILSLSSVINVEDR